jgi:hypothetical protein
MIRRYKIVINPAAANSNIPRANFSSNLISESGYLFYNNSTTAIEAGQLVNENNVIQYLENPDNAKVMNGFVEYLKSLLKKEEFEFIYNKPIKLYPILNNYYEQKVKLNMEPSKFLLFESLLSTKNVEYQDNNFNYESKTRITESKNKIIQTISGGTEVEIQKEINGIDPFVSPGDNFALTSGVTQNDYYINLKIDKKEASVLSTDYSKYFSDCVEDGVVLKNCFVDLNKKTDPFEIWTDSKFSSLNYVLNKSLIIKKRNSNNITNINDIADKLKKNL